MPASILDPVSAALRTSMSKIKSENSLDSQLAGSTKKALLSNIEFEAAGSYHNTVLDNLKSKYIVLQNSESPAASKQEEENMNVSDETLKLAKYELFPLKSVQLGWSNYDWSVGAGMINMGNTCYLNSTLQALFHVPALVNWLISDKDHRECQDSGVLCIICAMRKTLLASQQRNASSIRPLLIYNKLRLVCRTFIVGRQEDAHEFLRYLVEAMEKAYLSRFRNYKDFDIRTKETTPLNQILGGYLRSDVHCLECGYISTTFQHFQDLLLDIRKAQTLAEALEAYFSREKLDEFYHCESCHKKVPATKQFSLERAPMVLCIQLKRFSISNTKISKHIQFRQRLDLTKYARHRNSAAHYAYRLVAVVTHMGPTVTCGHYTAVAQAPTGNFYQFDDSTVRPISHQGVFGTNAYIMLYELESSSFPKSTTTATATATSTSKTKLETVTIEPEQIVTKPTTNGVGFTSPKVYGPELPPSQQETNGEVSTTTNGDGLSRLSISASDSDDDDLVIVRNASNSPPSVSQESPNEAMPLKSCLTKTKVNGTERTSPVLQKNSISSNSLGVNFVDKPKSSTVTTAVTKLVPYEAEDSSNSEDSARASSSGTPALVNGTVNTWKVSSSTEDSCDVPSTEGTSWQAKSLSPKDNTVKELFGMSHSGYAAASVSTWNGNKSQLTKEVANERREERKRAMTDTEEPVRVKHAKLHNNNNNFKSNPGYNPVQEFHNSKNWNQNNGNRYFNNNNNNNKQFYNSNNRHRRNFHHKNFHKNQRFRPT